MNYGFGFGFWNQEFIPGRGILEFGNPSIRTVIPLEGHFAGVVAALEALLNLQADGPGPHSKARIRR
jgi:hypothetical protein